MVLVDLNYNQMMAYRDFHLKHIEDLGELELLKHLKATKDIVICQPYALHYMLSDQYAAFEENNETDIRSTAINVDGEWLGYVFSVPPEKLGIKRLASNLPEYLPLEFDYLDFARNPYHIITRMWAEQYLCCSLRMPNGGKQTFVVMPADC